MLQGKHFEELNVGDAFTTARRTITETDVIQFVTLVGFIEPLFLDMEYIERESLFKRRIAPGTLVFAYSEGLVVQTGLIHGTGMAFAGLDKMMLKAPVCVGDTIQVEGQVIGKHEGKRADAGRVFWRHAVKNQRGEAVMEFEIARMMKKRGKP
ncbi:MAG TPA: MaoC/PaaZ C-terminal domain-containing protein [Candidatus Sulfotelmatobacter sp.]|nr:MaoC/PaaZ C-terminal domain-containing protein [Candidatus Sulfotelmatobacter sp.]